MTPPPRSRRAWLVAPLVVALLAAACEALAPTVPGPYLFSCPVHPDMQIEAEAA